MRINRFLNNKELKERSRKELIPEAKTCKEIVLSAVKVVSESDEEGLLLEFVISSGSIDRDLDTINQEGWELENYRKNPVMLWAHDYSMPPIAKSIKEWVEDGLLKSQVLFMPKSISDFGYRIGQMYKGGYLNAVSVGFIGKEYVWVEDNDRPWGIDFKRQELLEFSAVPVPSNPEALLVAPKSQEEPEAEKSVVDISAFEAQIKINRNKGGKY